MPLDEITIKEGLRAEYDTMLGVLERNRERAERLRALAEGAADQGAADERMLKSLGEVLGISAQTTLDDLGGALRGQRLRDVAEQVLREHLRPGDEVHYRDWFMLLQRRDLRVSGRDPLATFLAQVSRSDAVEAVGRRSGRYRLRLAA